MDIATADPRSRLDQAGIFASVGCAIHCMIAPFIFLFAPAMGGWWAHPSTHVIIALFVSPIAAFTLNRGYRMHRRKWILSLGLTGAALVALGTVFPWLEPLFTSVNGSGLSGGAGGAGGNAVEAAATGCANCKDCCPSVEIDEVTGAWDWTFPPASVLTMMGGVGLVSAHWGNLRNCKGCDDSTDGDACC